MPAKGDKVRKSERDPAMESLAGEYERARVAFQEEYSEARRVRLAEAESGLVRSLLGRKVPTYRTDAFHYSVDRDGELYRQDLKLERERTRRLAKTPNIRSFSTAFSGSPAVASVASYDPTES
jgi:hypothetical protein